jgi:uncharacterized RDD family membrane protein YckC
MSDDLKPAGLWVRYAAHTIDLVIFSTACALGLFSFGVLHGIFRFSDRSLGLLFLVLCAVLWSGNWLYYFLWHWNGGQTLGKRWLGIIVIGRKHDLLTFKQAHRRWLGYHLSYLTMGLGYLAAAFRPENQGLHDTLADTKVVHIDARRIWLEVLAVGLFGLLPLIFPVAVVNAGLSTYRHYFSSRGNEAELSTRNALGALRESLYQYQAALGRFPVEIGPKTFEGKDGYVAVFPSVRLPQGGHPGSYDVVKGPRVLEDSGRWVYDSQKGHVYIDCTHTDAQGTTIYSW